MKPETRTPIPIHNLPRFIMRSFVRRYRKGYIVKLTFVSSILLVQVLTIGIGLIYLFGTYLLGNFLYTLLYLDAFIIGVYSLNLIWRADI